ncbi:MAG: hypothetical protein ACHQAY_15060 [Hyphomicrobiales bacterium]
MMQGWYGDEYLILFRETAAQFEAAYSLSDYLPGYTLLGLKGWDDFIVQEASGACFTVPTVPLSSEYLESYVIPSSRGEQTPDDRGWPPLDDQGRAKIKWYLQPVFFGGDPRPGDNLTWVTLEEHAELVRWWNRLRREVEHKAREK